MVYMVLVGLGAWAAVATVACVSVCVAASRFYHEADPDESDGGLNVGRLSRG